MTSSRPPLPLRTHSHSNFATRTATDDAAQLDRRQSLASSPHDDLSPPPASPAQTDEAGEPNPEPPFLPVIGTGLRSPYPSERISRSPQHGRAGQVPSALQPHVHAQPKRSSQGAGRSRPIDSNPRAAAGPGKLGTFAGVFVPTSLNVLSILMFLRFGFILGQSGVVGMMGEFFYWCFLFGFGCRVRLAEVM